MWNKIYPLSTTSVSGSTDQIRANWEALENWWDVEHSTFTSAGSGTHTLGKVGSLLITTYAAISALTTPGTGAVAYDTTNGQLLIYRSTGWERLTEDKYSRIRKGFGIQTIPSTAWTQLASGTTSVSGEYDTLSEFSSSTFRFTAVNSGFYLIKAAVKFPTDYVSNYIKSIRLSINGTGVCQSNGYGFSVIVVEINDIMYLTTGDYIELYCYHECSTSIDINGGSLHIIRLS